VAVSKKTSGFSRGGWVVDKDRCVGFRRVELTTRVLSVGGGCVSAGLENPWRATGKEDANGPCA